jgi:hypothetical protein
MLRLKYEVVNDTLQNKRSPHFNGARGLLYEHGSHLAHSRDIKPNAEPRSPFIDYMLEETLADEHRSALTPEFAIFATAQPIHKCAQQSHRSRFPAGARMRANQAQIVATFCFSAVFTAHYYFFQSRIRASLRKLGTSSRRHLEVFSLLLLLPFLSILHLFHFFH